MNDLAHRMGEGQKPARSWDGAFALPAVLAVLVLFVLPATTFVIYSVLTGEVYAFGGEPPLTVENFTDVFSSATIRSLAGNSVLVGALVTVVTIGIALPVAYWLRYCAGRWQRPVLFLLVLTFFASYLVRVYAWRTILGSNGLLNDALERIGIIDEPLQVLLYSRFAVTLAIVHLLLPVVILIVFAGFRPLDSRYLECAQDLGAGPAVRWRRVILPLISVPLASAAVLSFVLSSSDYITPQLLGGPGQSMIGVEIQNQFKFLGDYPKGAALAITVVAAYGLVYGILALGLRTRGLTRLDWGGSTGDSEIGRHRRSRLAGLTTAGALFFLLAPLIVVVLFSFHSGQGLTLPFKGFSLRWYRSVLDDAEFLAAFRNSLMVAAGATTASFVCGTAAAYGLTKAGFRGRGGAVALLVLPLAVPGLFLGAALLTAFARIDLQPSLLTVGLAHFVFVSPFFFLLAYTAFSRLDSALEEVGADLGASPWQAFRRVTFPQLYPVLFAAAALSFILSFDEFFATFFVAGSDQTIPLLVFGRLRRTVDPTINVISTLLLLMTVVVWAAAALSAAWSARRRGRELAALEGLA